MDYYPAFMLVVVIGGFWGWAWFQDRRFKTAVAEAAAQLNGRHEPGGYHSGGTLFTKVGERDVVFSFQLSNSSRSESTSVGCCLRKPLAQPIELKGREAVAREARLQKYNRLLFPVKLTVQSNLVTVRLYPVIRNSQQLVDLANLVADLTNQFETSKPG